MAMKEQYIELKNMIETRLTQDIDEKTKEDLEKKLEKVNWAISEMDRYKKEGFPEDYGLLQSNIMFRKHNKEDCIKLMETWSNEVVNNSHRDQLSFNYALWKNSDVKIVYLDKNKSTYFNWGYTHGKKKSIKLATVKKDSKKKSLNELRNEFREVINKTRRVSTYKVPIYY